MRSSAFTFLHRTIERCRSKSTNSFFSVPLQVPFEWGFSFDSSNFRSVFSFFVVASAKKCLSLPRIFDCVPKLISLDQAMCVAAFEVDSSTIRSQGRVPGNKLTMVYLSALPRVIGQFSLQHVSVNEPHSRLPSKQLGKAKKKATRKMCANRKNLISALHNQTRSNE